jgi:hypothetical protein
MTSPASLLPCCRADLVVRPLGEDGPYEAGLLTGSREGGPCPGPAVRILDAPAARRPGRAAPRPRRTAEVLG